MPKRMSKAAMVKHESRETRAQEKRETPMYQRMEKKLGVEKHKK